MAHGWKVVTQIPNHKFTIRSDHVLEQASHLDFATATLGHGHGNLGATMPAGELEPCWFCGSELDFTMALASPFSMNSMNSGALRYAQCQWLSIQTQGCLWSVHELSDADSDLRMKLSQLQAPPVSGHLLVWTGGQKTSYWVAMELLLLLSLRGRRRLGNGEDKIGW